MLTSSFLTERDAVDADPDGQYLRFPVYMTRVSNAPNRGARGWTEGDIHIMGAVHPHHPAHNRPIHKLHTAYAQDTSSPRDCAVHLCWYVEHGPDGFILYCTLQAPTNTFQVWSSASYYG